MADRDPTPARDGTLNGALPLADTPLPNELLVLILQDVHPLDLVTCREVSEIILYMFVLRVF